MKWMVLEATDLHHARPGELTALLDGRRRRGSRYKMILKACSSQTSLLQKLRARRRKETSSGKMSTATQISSVKPQKTMMKSFNVS